MKTVSTLLGPIGVEDQGSVGEPVGLFWPSLFNDHHMWDRQVAALRVAGWRTLALDPPGHGQSPGPGRRFTMDECADAAVQVLEATDVQTPVVLFGTSWGGMVASRIALRAPDRVRGMVLTNTTAEPPTFFSRASGTLLTRLLAMDVLDRTVDRLIVSLNLAPSVRRRQPQIGADLATRFRSWDRGAVIHTVRSVLVDRDGVLDALADVNVPALIVSGEKDTVLPPAFSRRIAAKLPNARHVDVSGVAHLAPLEAPDVVNALIIEFLEQFPQHLH